MDLVTPMCPQLTYEGLLDEVSHCKTGGSMYSVENQSHGMIMIKAAWVW